MKIKNLFYGIRGTILKYMAVASITPLVLSLLIVYLFARSSTLKQAEQTMHNAINNVKTMCSIQNEAIDNRLMKDIQKAYGTAKNLFAVHTNIRINRKTTAVKVTNQATGEVSEIKLPVMTSTRGAFLRSYGTVDRIVQKVSKPGATATVFQFHENRMIRIATNVKTKEGRRAILTYIPEESLVYRTVKSGRPYIGRAMVVGKWTITHYQPIKTPGGKVIGALYVGVPAPKSAVFDMLAASKIGKSGSMYVFNSNYQVVWHPTRTGQNIKDFKDPVTGKNFVQEIANNKEGSITYFTENNEGKVTRHLAYYTYFQKWDWFIVAKAEYSDILRTMEAILFIITLILLGGIPFLFFVSNFVALKISKPLRDVINVATEVSRGDYSLFIPQAHYTKCKDARNCPNEECSAWDNPNRACWSIDDALCLEKKEIPEGMSKMEACCKDCKVYKKSIRNEIDELIEAINTLIVRTKNAVMTIKDMASDLNSNAESLSQTSRKLEMESANQAASIEETTSANEELMANIENVATAAQRQAEKVGQTSAAMEQLNAATKIVGDHSHNVSKETQVTVHGAKNTEKMLHDTTDSINQISKSSERIVDIVSIINDISDQINLLSLNASIEAARAGEHGKGFAIVAQEISKLADATAESTKEIEEVITTSRSEVATGSTLVSKTASSITEMIQKIEIAAKLIGEIASSSTEQMRGSEQVMSDVEAINTMSDQIAMATGEQRMTSQEILQAISRINESVQSVADSAQLVATLSGSLKEKSDSLKQTTDEFKVEREKKAPSHEKTD